MGVLQSYREIQRIYVIGPQEGNRVEGFGQRDSFDGGNERMRNFKSDIA